MVPEHQLRSPGMVAKASDEGVHITKSNKNRKWFYVFIVEPHTEES